MNTKINRAASALAAIILLGGCQRHGADAGLQATPVNVCVVRPHDVAAEVIASGAIEAIDKADVAFMVAGRVVSVDVEEGSLVHKGDLLARLDPSDYQKNAAIADAQFQEVKARQARLSRMHELGSLTDSDFDKINAALQETQSAAELAQRQLGYTELHAPFDGWIVKHGIAAGVVVAPGVPVFTVLSPGPVWANLGVAEVDIAKVRVGQNAAVYVPATGAPPQMGIAEEIVPQADVLSRAFTVKVRLQNPNRDLRHGNVVVGHILTGETRHVITVPPQVVQKHPDGSLYVWMVDPVRRTAVRQLVQVASLRQNEVEIAAGLKSGDEVVLNVPHTLFEGASLTVISTP
jgi:RND family efflux transporter MFP subunit